MIVPLLLFYYIVNSHEKNIQDGRDLPINSLSYQELKSSETSPSGNSSNILGYKINRTDDIQLDNRFFYLRNRSFDGHVMLQNEMLQTINDLEYPNGENWQPQGNDSSIEIDDNSFETTRQTNYSWIVNSTVHLTKRKSQPMKLFPTLTTDKYTELKNFQHLIVAPEYFNGSRSWNACWNIHAYVFGVLFLLIFCCAVFSIAQILMAARKFNRRYFVVLNAFIIIASITRSIYLLVDPYNYSNSYPDILNYFLFKTIYPCLSSSLGLVFIILSHSTRMKFLKPVVVIAISSFYSVFSFTSDILVGWFGRSVLLIMISQLTFVAWMAFLCSCYFYNYRALLNTASIKHNELLRMTFSRGSFGNSNIRQNIPKIAYCLVIRLALIASVLGMLLSVSHLCGIIFCFTAHSYVTPWVWWCYQTFCRLLELLMIFCICFLSGNTKHLAFHGNNITYSFCSLLCWCRYRTTFRNQRQNNAKVSFRTNDQLLNLPPPTVAKREFTERPNSLFTLQGYNRNPITTITEETEACETGNRILYVSKLNEFVCFPADKPSNGSDNSILANAGSRIPSITDEESPFLRRALQIRKWSPCSSAEVSSDQITPARIAGDEIKHGSSCSSESAGNSFDVAFFRNNGFWFCSKEANIGRCGYTTVGSPFRLQLVKDTVNVACGTDDVSPDSAINVDAQDDPQLFVLKQCPSDCSLNEDIREDFVDRGKVL